MCTLVTWQCFDLYTKLNKAVYYAELLDQFGEAVKFHELRYELLPHPANDSLPRLSFFKPEKMDRWLEALRHRGLFGRFRKIVFFIDCITELEKRIIFFKNKSKFYNLISRPKLCQIILVRS